MSCTCQVIAEGLKINFTLQMLNRVSRFYHYTALDAYYGESGFQGCHDGYVFVSMNCARSY